MTGSGLGRRLFRQVPQDVGSMMQIGAEASQNAPIASTLPAMM